MNQLTNSIRGNLLRKALQLTEGDRQATYGDPIHNLTKMAQMCSAYFDVEISANDVAIIMVFAKLSRVPASPTHEDNYVDGAAYFAIAGEMAAFGEISSLQGHTQSRANNDQNSGQSRGDFTKKLGDQLSGETPSPNKSLPGGISISPFGAGGRDNVTHIDKGSIGQPANPPK